MNNNVYIKVVEGKYEGCKGYLLNLVKGQARVFLYKPGALDGFNATVNSREFTVFKPATANKLKNGGM